MKTFLFKIIFIVIAIVTCSAFSDITDKDISFTAGPPKVNKKGEIEVPITFMTEKFNRREIKKIKAKVIQKDPAGKQLCTLNNTVDVVYSNDKNSTLIFLPCRPNKVEQSSPLQNYKIEISLSFKKSEHSQSISGLVDLSKAYPDLFKASVSQNGGTSTASNLNPEVSTKKGAPQNRNTTQPTSQTAIPGNKEENTGKPELQLEIFEFKGCYCLKIMIPSVSELKKTDVTVFQHYTTKQNLFYTISNDVKDIHKENADLNALYFIPNTSNEYKTRFTVKVKDKEYITVDKQIDANKFKNSDLCFGQIKEYLIGKQHIEKPVPDTGFRFKGLLIPLVILLLVGISYYARRQYLQRKSNETKPAFKAPVATVLPVTNSEEEIKFFETGPSKSFSPVGSIQHSKYVKLADLGTYYNDTTVANVFIEKGAAKEIFDFVWLSVQTKPSPEVGGFLMGRVQLNPERPGLHDVYINAFLKDRAPDFQNNVNISFSDGIASDELDYIDSHPGEEKVGWLHTHPGHGVFLSPTDIGSHFRSFPRPTQMAIVIESYDNFKTGIFSYRRGAKELNNISDKSTTIEYKSWKDFV